MSGLPITPFHYPIAKIIHKLDPKLSLSLPALIVGAMVPDLEYPFMLLFTGLKERMILHSLLGGLTLGTAIAVALTILVYPLLGRILPIDKIKLKEKCKLSLVVTVSCMVGVLSHVLVDIVNHTYNPVFWPFLSMYETPSPIVPLLGGADMASLLTHGLMVVLFVGLFVNNRDNFWNRLLVG